MLEKKINKTKKNKNAKKTSSNSAMVPLLLILAVAVVVVLIVVFSQTKETAIPTAVPETSEVGNSKQYASAPPMLIDPAKKYLATVKMEKGGEFVIDLFADKAPNTVNSFVFLARDGYFDGVTFHRVLDEFMAQTGDPTGTGSGGPGYEFAYEGNNLTFDKPGVVAMANTGPATSTNGSQFFITFVPVPQLNDGYTIFGQVTSGMDVVNAITRRDPDQSPDFTGDKIQSITISEE